MPEDFTDPTQWTPSPGAPGAYERPRSWTGPDIEHLTVTRDGAVSRARIDPQIAANIAAFERWYALPFTGTEKENT